MDSDVMKAAREEFSFAKFRETMHSHIDDAQRLADRNANGMACHLFAEHDKREFDRVFAGIEAAIKPQADATCPACSGSGAIEMGWVDGVCQRCGGMGIEAATQAFVTLYLSPSMPRRMCSMDDHRDELLPCPFCGAAARFVEVEEGAHAGGHFIECSDGRCGGSTNIMFAAKDDPKPHLREKWNSRARHPHPDRAVRVANRGPATHYCNRCGALWCLHSEGTMWSLVSDSCGKCCDNVEMGEQIIPLAAPQPDRAGDVLPRLVGLLRESFGYIEEAESPGEAWDELTHAWRAEADEALRAAKEVL